MLTATCKFTYYQNIFVQASLVTTSTHFYLLNVYEKITIVGGKFQTETECQSYSVSIILLRDLCQCIVQTTELQLLDTDTNC